MSKAGEIAKKLKRLDVSLLSDDDSPCTVTDWIPTGCVALDAIMGGGLPVGRITEIYGDPSTGKSLIGSQVAAMAQQLGYIVGYVDTETAVSKPMMEMVGVNLKELIYTSPDTVEGVFTFFEETMKVMDEIDPDNYLVLIWDSIAATSAKFEQESEFGKAVMGRHAQLISQSLRKITRQFARRKVAVLFLNQVRQKIGVMFGDNETTFGGMAVSFHASVRVKLDLTGKIAVPHKKRKKVIGMNTRATVVKNKVAMPFKEAILPVYFGHGIDDALASFYYLQDLDAIVTSGSWYVIELGGKEIKFQKKEWAGLYDEHFEVLSDFIMGTAEDGNDQSKES